MQILHKRNNIPFKSRRPQNVGISNTIFQQNALADRHTQAEVRNVNSLFAPNSNVRRYQICSVYGDHTLAQSIKI